MVTGGLPPPDIEQPIPHLDQLRTGPHGKRLAGLLLGISALVSTMAVLATASEFGGPEIIASLLLVVVAWIAAIRMFRKGAAPDADKR